MRIFLAENGLKTGPFLLWEVRARLERGELGPDTLGWHEGCDAWMPLRDLPSLGLAGRDTAPDEPLPGAAEFSAPATRDIPNTSALDTRPRPWQRYAARMFDMYCWFTLIALAMKPFGGDFTKIFTEPLWLLGSQALMLLAEAACLSLFGASPGKAVLGLRVVTKGAASAPMVFQMAMHRTMLVFLIGSPAYLPVYFSVFAWIFHFFGLSRHGATWWDRRLGTEVVGTPMAWRRGLTFVLWILLMQITMNALVGEEMRLLLEKLLQKQV